MFSQNPDHIPTQSIDIDPPALDPGLPLSLEEGFQRVIVKLVLPHFMLRKVHHDYLASSV